MSQEDSISQFLSALQRGDAESQKALCDRYFNQLARLARHRLDRLGARRRAADEEDVALSVFESLFRRAEQGKFPQLSNRHDLWRILFTMVDRKSKNQVRNERAGKRGGGKVAGESVFQNKAGEQVGGGLAARAEDIEPTAAEITELSDVIDAAFGRLDPEFRQIAELRLDGLTVPEVAERIGKSVATVERRLRIIRATWEQLVAE